MCESDDDEEFVSLYTRFMHRLQNCNKDSTTTATSGPEMCEAVLHGCETRPV